MNQLAQVAVAELVRDYQAQRAADVFSELYRRYYPKVLQYCTTILKDRPTAMDETQEVFLIAVEKIDKLRDPSTFVSWLFRIAHNECIDYLKARSRYSSDALDERFDLVDDSRDIHELEEMERQIIKVQALIEQLPTESRDFLQLKYLQGLSIQDLQSRYHLSESAVKMRLMRARARVVAQYGSQLVA